MLQTYEETQEPGVSTGLGSGHGSAAKRESWRPALPVTHLFLTSEL